MHRDGGVRIVRQLRNAGRGKPRLSVASVSASLLLVAVLVGAAAGVSGPARAEPAPATNRPPPQALLALSDRVLGEVCALRGLRALRPIKRSVMSRDAILRRLHERVAQDLPPDDILDEERLLKRLGLIPETMDYERTVFDLLGEQVAGFYDQYREELSIADWVPEALQVETVSHELEHALQDQNFGLRELMRHRPGQSDRGVAISALAEGDGMAVMLDLVLARAGLDIVRAPNVVGLLRSQIGNLADQPQLRAVPRGMREALLFPYLDGLEFVRALRIAGGWARVDQAFRAPPASSEQVMHPDRFLAGDAPETVSVGALPSLERTHRRVHEDVMGELGWRLFLEEHLPSPDGAAAAAEGWGGDRIALYVRDLAGGPAAPGRTRHAEPIARLAIVALTTWDAGPAGADPDAEARGFEQALVAALAHRFPQARDAGLVGTAARVDGASAFLVERRGRRVAYAEGIPAGALAPVRAEIWNAWH